METSTPLTSRGAADQIMRILTWFDEQYEQERSQERRELLEDVRDGLSPYSTPRALRELVAFDDDNDKVRATGFSVSEERDLLNFGRDMRNGMKVMAEALLAQPCEPDSEVARMLADVPAGLEAAEEWTRLRREEASLRELAAVGQRMVGPCMGMGELLLNSGIYGLNELRPEIFALVERAAEASHLWDDYDTGKQRSGQKTAATINA